VIAWAFEEQDRIRSETKADPAAAARIVKQRFPALAACIGSPDARSRLNKSMRWVVSNSVRVSTPQLYLDKVKLCDEDVDLGLEYTLSNMLERHAKGTLTAVPVENTAAQAPATRPAKPEPARPASPRPEAAKPEATRPEAAKPEATKPEAAAQPEATKPEAAAAEAARSGAAP
jgi:hypothetical protein